VILPDDGDYEPARLVWNRMINQRPGVIVQCAEVEDVIRAVNFARDHDLLTAVRAGGHSLGGKSVCDGGIVIDVGAMKRINIDPGARTVRTESGIRLGEFDRATQAFGLATTAGTDPDTGLAGLALGGGLGWIMGKHGLTCDNLLAAELVTADGRVVRASEEENPDLFWGLRGGGGNFGVVTSFEFELHPIGLIFGGALMYPAVRGGEVLRFVREYAQSIPDEVTLGASVATVPGFGPALSLIACYCGDLETGEKVLQPLVAATHPAAGGLHPTPYVEMQALGALQLGQLSFWRSGFFSDLERGVIDVLAANMARPEPCGMFMIHLHGAVSRVDPAATAFRHRRPGFDLAAFHLWPNPAQTGKYVALVTRLWEAMAPFSNGGVYVNTLLEEGDQRVRDAYGDNYDRLVALKNKYDPDNFFRMNQNIQPGIKA
jgi:FAD/FMN-containing dehydrogenase